VVCLTEVVMLGTYLEIPRFPRVHKFN